MQSINLDISRKHSTPPIYAKQGEVGRKFLAVITDNGQPFHIPNNALLSVWYEGDTDAGNYSSIKERSAFSIDGNKVIVELVAQMLLQPGKGELCLSITHGDGGEINTWNIPYSVEYKPGAGSSVPTEYYTAFQEMAALVAKYAEEAKRASQSMEVLAPVGYVFQWLPVDESDIDLSTAQKVHDHFGFGTWEQIKDRFLLSAGDTFTAGSTGGEQTHTITEGELPEHRHKLLPRISNPGGDQLTTSAYATILTADNLVAPNYTGNVSAVDGGNSGYTGNNKAMNNMPPYLTVYIWKRIA